MTKADLDTLLDAIEALRGDRKAAMTVLMSAAVTCMHAVLDNSPLETIDVMPRPAGFRVLVLGEHRVDLVAGDHVTLVAMMPPPVIQ